MKSRMDKYYSENELMQRTSKNDSLYDELYREKQTLSDNMVLSCSNSNYLLQIKEIA